MITKPLNLSQSLINNINKKSPKSNYTKIKNVFPLVYQKIKKLKIEYNKLKNYNEIDLQNLFQINSQTAIILRQMMSNDTQEENYKSVPSFYRDNNLMLDLSESKVNYLEIDKIISILVKANYLIYFEKNYSLITKMIELNISFYKLLFLPIINVISAFQISKKDAKILIKICQKYIKTSISNTSFNLYRIS